MATSYLYFQLTVNNYECNSYRITKNSIFKTLKEVFTFIIISSFLTLDFTFLILNLNF